MTQDAQTAFFSYCRGDSDFALRLAGDLKAAGASVWLDQLDITPGQRWDRAVEDALANCLRILVILSPASVNSTNVMDEVSFALEEKKTVIPVIHKDCTVPFRLRRLQYVDFRKDYARGLKELLNVLPPHLEQEPSTSVSPNVRHQFRPDILVTKEHETEAGPLEEERQKPSEQMLNKVVMKYFIYISGTKVDMLYAQIPSSVKDSIALAWQSSVRLASFKEKESREMLYSRLKVVTDYIEKHLEVGTIDNPRTYFKGCLDVNWGPLGAEYAGVEGGPVVFFGGTTEKTIVGLGGSFGHLVGGAQPTSPGYISSSAPYLLSALSKELDLNDSETMRWIATHSKETTEEYLEARTLSMVGEAVRRLKYKSSSPGSNPPILIPKERIEFLAKRLLHGLRPEWNGTSWQRGKTWVLLGTPIYVAQAN